MSTSIRKHSLLRCPFALGLAVCSILAPLTTGRPMAGSEIVSDGAPKADPATVVVETEQLKNLRVEAVQVRPFQAERRATGRIAFNDERTTPVFPPYAGHVVRLLCKPGDMVERGTPLLELEAPDLVQAEADLWASLPALTKADAAIEHARRSEDRQHRLYLEKAVALKDWEQAQADVQSAQSDQLTAQAAVTASRDKLRIFGKTDAEILTIEHGHQIDRLIRITAPIAGTVTSRKVGPGQYVKTDNPDPLFTITDLSSLWMQADVFEADAPYVAIGQAVEMQVMACPERVFKAKIDYISPAVDPTTHRLAVRCVIDNSDRVLRSEMFANFKIISSASAATPAVSVNAVVRDGDKQVVWVAQADHHFARHEVTTGIQQNGLVQILTGIATGDRVVSDGAIFLGDL